METYRSNVARRWVLTLLHSMPMSAKPVSLNGNVLDYIICYPGIEIPCCGELLEEKDGKIARYHVCYRAE